MVHRYVFLILHYVNVISGSKINCYPIIVVMGSNPCQPLFVGPVVSPNWHLEAYSVVVSTHPQICWSNLDHLLSRIGVCRSWTCLKFNRNKHSTSFFAAPQVTNLEHALPNRTSTLIQVQIGTRTGFLILLTGNVHIHICIIRISNIFSCKVRC